jgi:serine/threonine protein kinase/formylglycine-generating enzyme required for sulfatase activity
MAGPEQQTFAGYEILGELGRGGMGAVYKARQPKLDRLVALKVMATELAADPEFVARFKREATAAAALNHENIVQVFSAGESEKTHFIAMEFVEGTTLRQHIESLGRLDPREAIAVTVRVAEALQYAWNKARIIHRDIKPENIFLSHTGEVKVGDLGLAKTVGGGSTSLTQTGMMMGSPHYISPEQARGLSDIDFRTDIYSLGCTLYHMLTGRPPYTGTDPLVVINKHVNEPPPAIFKVWPTCPIPLALLVGKMLAKQRHERPASYEDLIEQLHEVREKLKPATTVAPVSPSEPTQKLPTPAPAPPTQAPVATKTPTVAPKARESKPVIRNSRLVIGAGIAVVLLLGGLFLWSPWKAEQGSESRLQAESASEQPAKAGTPNAVASAAESWQDWIAESRRSGTMPKDFNDDGGAWLCPKAGTALTLAKSIRNGGLRATYTIPKGKNGQVVLEMRSRGRSNKDAYGAAVVGQYRHVFVYRSEQGQMNRIATETLPAGFDPSAEMTLEFRVVGDELSCKLNGQTVLTRRDSMFSQEGEATIRCTTPDTRISRIEVLNLDGASTSVIRNPQSAIVPDAALKQLGSVYKNAVGAEMVAIPPGEFMLGSTKEEQAWAVQNGAKETDLKREGEAPRKTAIKQGFWMGRTKVTVGQWKQFVKETAYVTDGEKKGEVWMPPTTRMKGKSWRDPGFAEPPKDNNPVSGVSWNDAVAFCEWLAQQERKSNRLPAGFTVRLPTEAEWEYACRAGTQTKFWWGESTEDSKGRLNCLGTEDGFEFVSPVDCYGERGRNGFGLADMLGNVWEWCLDSWHMQQAQSEYFKGGSTGRVVRGGTFMRKPFMLRVAYRGYAESDNADVTRGFRVCLGPDVLGSAGPAVSNAPPVISNWQDVMPLVRAEMDKSRAARHEDGWVVVVQDPRSPIYICNQPLGDIAVRGRFRSEECSVHLAVSGTPSKCYVAYLKRGNGAFILRRYVGTKDDNTLETQNIGPLCYPAADEHDFLITKVGDLLSAWVDGTFAGSARDATVASGKARIYLSHPGQAIRDLAIADLSAAAPAVAERASVQADAADRTLARSATDAAWQNAINLLPLIDPQKDAVDGGWTVRNGELVSDAVNYSRIEIPYQLPDEYDFVIEFSVPVPKKEIGPIQLLSKAGREFRWQCYCRPNSSVGFESVRGLNIRESPARTELGIPLEMGKRYISMVQVRNGVVRGYVDGKLCVEWKTDYADMDIDPKWKLRTAGLLGIGSQVPTVFHRIEVREVTGKGTFTRAAPPAPDAGWQNAINLLPLIDPQKDAVEGTWALENGGLKGESTGGSPRVQIPYQPPDEYDFRITFARQKGAGVAYQMLTGGGRPFAFCIAAQGSGLPPPKYLGFAKINGKDVNENPTAVRLNPDLEAGRHYTALVQVRKDRVMAFLDGRLVSEWKTDYQDMSIHNSIRLRDDRSLGLGSSPAGGVVFYSAEVREVTGKGTFTRGASGGETKNTSSNP